MSWILSAALLAFSVLTPLQQTQFQGLTLSTPFPSQVVPPGNTVNLPIEVHAYGLPPQVVDLSITNAPADWQVHFIGDGRVVTQGDVRRRFDFERQIPARFWPELTGLIAAVILLFALAYVLFQRQEVRA